MKTPGTGSTNEDLLRRAADAFPGRSLGVFFLPDGLDFVAGGGRGAKIYDVEGNEYLDYLLAGGPMILGHADPRVTAAVSEQWERGTTYYTLNEPSIQLAEEIISASPCSDTLRYCNSGSEATFYALRLARAATGRPKILKFEGAYHGHHDFAQMSWAPSVAKPYPQAVPDSAGIAPDVMGNVLIAPFNNLETTVALLEANKDDLAAVIVEPGCRLIDPLPGFLEGLREATKRLGIILVFDEVVTGFRVAYGGAQALYGVIPDLACYGKIIGGGTPLAAVAGKREIMELSNPRKKGATYSFISGTLNGNASGAAAGLATLKVLKEPGSYARLNALGERIRKGFREIGERLGIPVQVVGVGPMAYMYFTSTPIIDFRTSLTGDKTISNKLAAELLKRGVLAHTIPKLYLSLAHTDADIDSTLQKYDDSLKVILGKSAVRAVH